ncbi:MAG: nucleotidyl transferase AbiEii/AbiGii toxin family protein [Eubacteriales bacterium]|nr:nucleotidyl transferase AbiEii/AbiGii toxin family protein [Eubacteriales bacterium]MDY3332393.1 nucleotidyl transferase AbiEii/AbiGii toxin family protein [Gallibacter sp.]
MTVIDEMIRHYSIESEYDKVNAMKEIIQEITLCGLSRAGFFKEAAFYGGTAMRMFYGLDRFSEDLDFSLMQPNLEFDISKFFPILSKEVEAYGLNLSIESKSKSRDSDIKSAFIKGNTKEHLLLFYNDMNLTKNIPQNSALKIKLEIDINPPAYADFERKYKLLPAPYEVNMYDEASLFARKIHAVICRNWKTRVKGRDLYDYMYYVSRNAKINIRHLRERLVDSNFITNDVKCDLNNVKEILFNHFEKIDYEQAKEDVKPFIKDYRKLELWSAEFFKSITERIKEKK